MTDRIRIETSRPYDVLIGDGLLDQCGQLTAEVCRGKAAVIADDTVAALYEGRTELSLQQAGFETSHFTFPHGEKSKSMLTLGNALEFLAENQITKSDVIIALGGGVTGDLAGFAAAVYQRGISFIQIPTTLLAAIDSSVGGKTAVDLKAGKNLAGVFWQPSRVICDPQTLKTLPPETFAEGIAEALKDGVIFDKDLFNLIAGGNIQEEMTPIITRCVDWKRQVVEKDEHDNAERQLLNFGHTFGHAIERCSHFEISHGRAVAIGMVMMAHASWKTGLSKENCEPAIRKALLNRNLPTECPFNAEEIYNGALQDKKRRGSTLTLIIPETLGHCVLHPMPVDDFRAFTKLAVEGSNEN